MQARGPAPEARFPVDRASGPGGSMLACPTRARGALLAVTAKEPFGNGREKSDMHTVPNVAT